jgi:hypothetical protein
MKPTLFALIIIIVLSLTQGCVLLKNQEQSKLIAERAAYRAWSMGEADAYPAACGWCGWKR